MDKTIKYLGMFLDSPLQSWGHQSRFDQRTTLAYPTKSGTLGIICAAMGIAGDDNDKLHELAKLSMQSYSLVRKGIQARRIKDFHTVGGGYKDNEKQNKPRKASGGAGGTVVTNREYLMDVKFAVIFGGDEQLISDIGEHLRDPVWGVWCGRKSCIPTSPIFQGVYEDAGQALQSIIHTTNTQPIREVIEVDNFEDGTDYIRDVPVDFLKRDFSVRRISDNHL